MLNIKKRKTDDELLSDAAETLPSISNKNDPSYIVDREELEKVRIDALYKIEEERSRNLRKKKEIEALEKLERKDDGNNIGSSTTTSSKVKEILQSGENIVKLMVGGKMFVTSLSTINRRDNMIKTMLNSDFKVDTDENGCILLSESNPDYFPIILEHIRTGSTNYVGLCEYASNENIQMLTGLLFESDFFGTSKLSAKIATLIKEYNTNQNNTRIVATNEEEMVDDEPKKESKLTSNKTNLYSNQQESDDKWLEKFTKLTLSERSAIDEFMKTTQEVLEKERDELRQRESSLKKEPITFNVRGVKFICGIEKLLVHNESILPQLVLATNTNEIFLDRDSDVFFVIFEYLEKGTFNSVPKEFSKRKLVYKEAKEFKLKGMVEYLDPLRYPVEEIGLENLKIKKDEDFLRELYVSDRENPLLADPYIHLVSIFGNEMATRSLLEPCDVPSTIPLLFDFENPVEASELVNEHSDLVLPPSPKLVSTREEFFTQFNALTCGIFMDMDWSNIFCAGGGILACLLKAELKRSDLVSTSRYGRRMPPPIPEPPKKKILYDEDDGSESDQELPDLDESYFSGTSSESEDEKIQTRAYNPRAHQNTPEKCLDEQLYDYFQKSYWKNSDIDLFIYGLNEKEAETKIATLYNLFKQNLANIPTYARESEEDAHKDILLLRTENAISFKFISSVRTVQVILRIYKSPAEVLIGFDVNCCCVGFDGNQVYALPRAIQAIRTRCNIVDVDRQSTTYELRLAKYALRGFRIGVAGFDEKRIQNDILIKDHFYRPNRRYNRPKTFAKLGNVTGLAKILLIRHSYKHSKYRDGLKAIGGGRNLDSHEKKISKSKYHDYVQVYSPRYFYGTRQRFTTAESNFQHIKARTEYLTKDLKKKLFFEYSLNDLNGIISPTEPISDLPTQLEWITYEPTRQYVCGSFHPHKLNFFKDAYSDFRTESKFSGKKKMCKYQWSIVGRRYRKNLTEQESRNVENAYRLYKKGKGQQEYVLNDGKIIDFVYMNVKLPNSGTQQPWGWRSYSARRTIETTIYIKPKEVAPTNIHEVLYDYN